MQVHFLAWAGELKPTTIGPVRLQPWSDFRATLDEKTRAFLDLYFSRYQNNTGTAVEDITIASITANPLDDITQEQRSTIRSAVDLLTFASIIPNLRTRIVTENHFGTPNSERFQLTTQLLGDLKPFVAVSTRGVTHAWGINDIHFCMPWDAGTTSYRTDNELLTALGHVLDNQLPAARTRLLRTTEWFRLAHTGSPETNEESRVVMMSTAFEILLDAETQEKRGPMATQLTAITKSDKLPTTPATIGKFTYELNAVGHWFCTFYALRNKIVHGDQLTNDDFFYDDGITHLDVADLVLWETISWELAAAALLGKKAREHAEWFSQAWSKQPASPALLHTIMSGIMGLNVEEYHDALGWTETAAATEEE